MILALLFTLLGFGCLAWADKYSYTPGYDGILLRVTASMFFVASIAICVNAVVL
jgi:hypothetical protein